MKPTTRHSGGEETFKECPPTLGGDEMGPQASVLASCVSGDSHGNLVSGVDCATGA